MSTWLKNLGWIYIMTITTYQKIEHMKKIITQLIIKETNLGNFWRGKHDYTRWKYERQQRIITNNFRRSKWRRWHTHRAKKNVEYRNNKVKERDFIFKPTWWCVRVKVWIIFHWGRTSFAHNPFIIIVLL